MISLYQGAAIMIIALVLFENEFLNIVAISFTALILNELIMVALEITKWYVLFLPTVGVSNNSLICRHVYMIISEVVTLGIYAFSMIFLPEYFGSSLSPSIPSPLN
jgi:phospholipid-translocating ATPase